MKRTPAAVRSDRWCDDGKRRRLLRLLLLFVAGTNLAFALFPFRLDIPGDAQNGVRRDTDGSLRFSGVRNEATTRGPPSWVAAVAAGSALALQLTVRPAEVDQFGPARIFTVSADYWHANLVVAQEGTDLVVRVRREHSTRGGTPPYVVRDVFAADGWRDVQVDLARDRLAVVVDGQQRLLARLDGAVTGTWDPSYRLALGDEVIGGRAWRGQIRHATVVVDGARTDYVEPPQLDIPSRSSYLPGRLRERPPLKWPEDAAVAGLHMAGCVPLGLILAALLARRFGPLAWLSTCLLFVTVLQQGKVFVAGRHPATIDLAAYLTGCVVGGLVWRSSASDRGQAGRT